MFCLSRINLDYPNRSNSAAKKLTVFVPPQLHCTFNISPPGNNYTRTFISDETFYGAFAVFETIFETRKDASLPRAQVSRSQEDKDANTTDQGGAAHPS